MDLEDQFNVQEKIKHYIKCVTIALLMETIMAAVTTTAIIILANLQAVAVTRRVITREAVVNPNATTSVNVVVNST